MSLTGCNLDDCAGHQSIVHEVRPVKLVCCVVVKFEEQILLVLWLKTVHPYLEILDKWISSDILYDYYDEICIKMLVGDKLYII